MPHRSSTSTSSRRYAFARSGALLLLVLLGLATSCGTPVSLPLINLREPGWTVRRGEAIWRRKVGGEGIAGEVSSLAARMPKRDVWLSGWELLGHAIFARVQANMWKVLVPMICLVLLSLWPAFRRVPEVLLGLAVLLLSGLWLLAIMRVAGWSWNLLDLMAIPLVLGTGVDYSLFMLLALRRYRGDLATAYRSVGRALLLCGGTAAAAFSSLAWSTNSGMASLGRLCAVGIAFNMFIAIFLLPVWWHKAAGPIMSTRSM